MKVQIIAFQHIDVKILSHRGKGCDTLLYAVPAYTNRLVFDSLFSLWIQIILTLPARELCIQARLSLLAQIFHHSCKNNNNSVSSISSFVADCGVICGFAGLDITQHQSASLKRFFTLRISEQIDDLVRNFIQRCGNSRIPMFYFLQIFFISIPEEKVQICSSGRKPRFMRCISIIDVHADIHLYNNRCTQTDKNFCKILIRYRKCAHVCTHGLCKRKKFFLCRRNLLVLSANRCRNDIFQHCDIRI